MKTRGFRRFVAACLSAACLLTALSVPCSAAGMAVPVQARPDFVDLGGGFYAYSMSLTPEMRERLMAALPAGADGAEAAQTLFAISAGQSPNPPSNPIETGHGALSDATFPYNYWFIVLNLGTKNVRKKTTLKLTGPGLKFNRSIQFNYPANGIWLVGHAPNAPVAVPGVYTFQATVDGGGSITNKSFAVFP